jgi:hypothetical protein
MIDSVLGKLIIRLPCDEDSTFRYRRHGFDKLDLSGGTEDVEVMKVEMVLFVRQ